MNRRHNPGPPRGYGETYKATRVSGWDTYILAWTDREGRGYELALAPYTASVVFARGAVADGAPIRRGDVTVEGKLRRGEVVVAGDAPRALGAAGRLVFAQMWRRLLDRMAGPRARRNAAEHHGEELDGAMQDEIDEAFRTLPVRVYRGRRRR